MPVRTPSFLSPSKATFCLLQRCSVVLLWFYSPQHSESLLLSIVRLYSHAIVRHWRYLLVSQMRRGLCLSQFLRVWSLALQHTLCEQNKFLLPHPCCMHPHFAKTLQLWHEAQAVRAMGEPADKSLCWASRASSPCQRRMRESTVESDGEAQKQLLDNIVVSQQLPATEPLTTCRC